MAESRTVRVTPNVLASLAEIRKALKSLPAGEVRRRGLAGADYLARTFAGRRQPAAGRVCPRGTDIIKV